jgi:hypothetical protein
MPAIASERMRWANCSAGGPMNSPNTKVMTAKIAPTLKRAPFNRVSETPEALITVYSVLATS